MCIHLFLLGINVCVIVILSVVLHIHVLSQMEKQCTFQVGKQVCNYIIYFKKSPVSLLCTNCTHMLICRHPESVYLLLYEKHVYVYFVFSSSRPLLEVCLPSSLDSTLAPPGCHVMSIFSQYTPYELADGKWTEERKEQYADVGMYIFVG